MAGGDRRGAGVWKTVLRLALVEPMAYGILVVTGGMTHQENYARGFAGDARAKLIAVSDEKDVDERRARLNAKLAAELGIPHVADLDVALARSDVHAVSICAEHQRQGRVALRCAEAGKHIYIDKPLAGSLDEALRLETVVREKKLRSQMFTHVHMPAGQRIGRILQNSGIGELRAIHQDLQFAKGYPGDFEIARRKEQTAPKMFLYPDAKRELFNIAVYTLAMARWLTGRKAFLSVRAVTGNYFFETNRRRDFEDFGVMAVNMEDGVVLTLSAGRTGWKSHPGGGHFRTKLIGSKGSVFIDSMAPHGEISAEGQSHWKTPPENPDDPMGFWQSTDQRKSGGTEWFFAPSSQAADQRAFLTKLETGLDGEVNIADGVRVLEALFAAYRSAATGEVVAIGQG